MDLRIENLNNIPHKILANCDKTDKVIDLLSCVNGGIYIYTKEELAILLENEFLNEVVEWLCKTSTELASNKTTSTVLFYGEDEDFILPNDLVFTETNAWNEWYEVKSIDFEEFYYVKSLDGKTVLIHIPNATNTKIANIIDILNERDKQLLHPLNEMIQEFVERFPK